MGEKPGVTSVMCCVCTSKRASSKLCSFYTTPDTNQYPISLEDGAQETLFESTVLPASGVQTLRAISLNFFLKVQKHMAAAKQIAACVPLEALAVFHLTGLN